MLHSVFLLFVHRIGYLVVLITHYVEFSYLYDKMLRIIIRKTTFLCLCLLVMDGVFGADTDAVKSVSVMEGDSVILNPDVTEIQSDEQVVWMFGPQKTRLAELHRKKIYIDDSNTIFEKKLQIDNQTGSLTIRNIRTEHTGLYKLQLISNKRKLDKTFNVTVYAPLPVPVITSDSSQCSSSERSSTQYCSLVCSVLNVSHVTLSWYAGISVLSSISVCDLSISLSLPLDVEYQDNNTYSCVINNPVRNQTTHLNITQLCQTCKGDKKTRLYAALIPAVVLAVLAVVMYCLYRKSRRPRPKGNYVQPSAHAAETVQEDQDEVPYTETTFVQNAQNKKPNGTEETIYSIIVKH